MTYNRVQKQIEDTIRHIWYRLTDAEIQAHDEARDVFFLAVRKKHGLARAQAELFLRDIKQQLSDSYCEMDRVA